MKKAEYGAFCEVYGKSLRNLMLEFMLENKGLDFSVGDIAEELSISRPKAYQIIKEIEKEGIAKKSRIVSGTQLYILNDKSRRAVLLIKGFKECLKVVAGENPRKGYSSHGTAAVSARSL